MKLALFLAAIPLAFACRTIDADRILGKDLAAEAPLFASLDPGVEVGAAPSAGVQRVMQPDELVRLARLYGIALASPATAVCFERATEPMTAEKLLPILRTALEMDSAQIEILDFSRFGVPRGRFEFPKSSLMPNGLWRGRVLYDQNHSMPVWVKARVTVEKTWVEAAETLPMGKTVSASQLLVRTGPRFPFEPPLLATLDEATGRKPTRTLAMGVALAAGMLATAHEVERGDIIAVEVKVGGATLAFQATAESSGRTGDQVMVKNPENGKTFLAKIQGKGHVLVER
jgi:flagella basal body P-ring formation protein FlgA